MMTISLNGGWRCIGTLPDQATPDSLTSAAAGNQADWLPVTVPGDVNAALVRHNRMPDPYHDDNGRKCHWVTSRDWWWRLEFKLPHKGTAPHMDLCLDGVDGYADVFLNGQSLGTLKNAFRQHRLSVAKFLRKDAPNVLLLRFPALESVLKGPRLNDASWGRGRRGWIRKPQFSFGWDWSIPLPSIGIMGGVRLECHDGPRLDDVAIRTWKTGRTDFYFRVNRAARDAGYCLKLKVRGYGFELERKIERPGRVVSYLSFVIPDAKLWWPNGYGEQTLYDYEIECLVKDKVVDRRKEKFGLRETNVDEKPFTPEAGPGWAFWININGKPVFCKGANWVPLEIWPAEATEEQYRFYLEKAREAHFNMLRVWGGGIYEREIFYDLCDEYGIMVWQDFMFGSGGYPVDWLREEIAAEAEYQIKRLRNRPCIAIWCGCNEDVFSWSLPEDRPAASADTGEYADGNTPGPVNRLRDDPMLYTMLLRGLVSKHGLGVPYVESSPQSCDDFGNLPESGNCHISCWKFALFETAHNRKVNDQMLASGVPITCNDLDSHPEEFRRHFEKVCSFNSEFCIQGPCDLSTFKRFLSPSHRWPPDDVWVYHVQRGHANLTHFDQTLLIAGGLFGEITTLEQYVKYGQATHAEMMRAEYESARRDRPNNGGTMVWQFNDCWPTANWSIIDYYRRPKPSYYAARRACAPLLPIIFERGSLVEFFFSNDTATDCRVQLHYGQCALNGKVQWERTTEISVPPMATARFDRMERREMSLSAGNYCFIEATLNGTKLPQTTYFPLLWKNVSWPKPHYRVRLLDRRQNGSEWITRLEIKTDAYARFCHIIIPSTREACWLDDNFFDLRGGNCHVVAVKSKQPLETADVQIGDWHSIWP